MDIDGCGEGNLQKLIDAGLVKSAADLYDLTVEQLLPLGKKVDTWGEQPRPLDRSEQNTRSVAAAVRVRHSAMSARRQAASSATTSARSMRC